MSVAGVFPFKNRAAPDGGRLSFDREEAGAEGLTAPRAFSDPWRR
jgi:hypothetical protein